MEFKDILKQTRIKNGIKQSELGEKVGLSIQTISAYEKGVREPKLKILAKLADIFDVSIDYLIGRERQEGNQFPLVDINDLEEKEMLEMYKHLSKDDQEKVRAIIKTLAEMNEPANNHNAKKNDFAG